MNRQPLRKVSRRSVTKTTAAGSAAARNCGALELPGEDAAEQLELMRSAFG